MSQAEKYRDETGEVLVIFLDFLGHSVSIKIHLYHPTMNVDYRQLKNRIMSTPEGGINEFYIKIK